MSRRVGIAHCMIFRLRFTPRAQCPRGLVSPPIRSFIGVRIVPGMTEFTRIPRGAYSTAACRVRASTPPLLAA